MQRGCCLIGALFPVLISWVRMVVCPKFSSKTSENSSSKFFNLPICPPCSDGSIIDSILSEITCGVVLLVDYPVRMGSEVISIQNGGGMLTSSIRRAHGVRTKVGRLRKHSVLKSDWFSINL